MIDNHRPVRTEVGRDMVGEYLNIPAPPANKAILSLSLGITPPALRQNPVSREGRRDQFGKCV